jgi:hypothetical protein
MFAQNLAMVQTAVFDAVNALAQPLDTRISATAFIWWM